MTPAWPMTPLLSFSLSEMESGAETAATTTPKLVTADSWWQHGGSNAQKAHSSFLAPETPRAALLASPPQPVLQFPPVL